MPKDKAPGHPQISKKDCYSKIAEHSINAMKFRKMGEHHSSYPIEIALIAEACACLLTVYSEKLQAIISQIETSLQESHKEELKKLDGEIITLFNRRKKALPATPSGEREIVDLTVQINALERRKTLSIAELIELIVCDALNHTCKEHGVEFLEHFNPEEYEYHGEISFIRSSAPKP
ncbi:hypothetical protein [uncultured Legionella sp.]|uniref:hypothetical protein n=1 Tax=uncultured Legionella sp. TaxID=210934 RepID=UPI0026278297|nr:hypothetical protein [uncultured Legionella sp.]